MRGSGITWKRLVLVLTAAMAAAGTYIFTSASSRKDAVSTGIEKVPAWASSLNDTLTNSMSGQEDLEGMDRAIENFRRRWGLKGLSLAVMRNDSLLFAKGYGWADEEAGEEMTPGNILRMASVSKLITATGIMKLQEEGKLTLGDTVFGPDGILCDSSFTKAIGRKKNYFQITVEDLLRHKGGFTCAYGDPMFSTRDIMRQFRLEDAPDQHTLVECMLKRPLGYAPGSWQRYSNFGYLLLSMVIEKVSGQTYEDYIKENILWPAGCLDMHIAGNYYEEKYPNEVKYYMHAGSEPCEEYNLSGNLVEKCYGGNNITGLSGAGAWCGSPAELCRFVAAIDGRPHIPDIISRESVEAMTEYFNPETFSLGWNDTRPDGEWTRTGTFSGTSALVKCYPDGECWVMITNTSTWRGPGLARYSSALFKKCRERYSPLLPERDMFSAVPSGQKFFRIGMLPEIQSPELPKYVFVSTSPDNTI